MISQESAPSGEELVDQAIAEYLRAEAAGNAGDRQQWIDRYPECADSLAAFFDDRERIDRLVSPMRTDRAPHDGNTTNIYSPGPAAPPSGLDITVDISPEPPLLSSTRYRPLSFHARGGMGEIWVAKDERIGRHVALKKLRSGRELQKARFYVEAQITGQLEHPSIVPLHDIGVDDAGNPFYVMKFMRGRRLKDAITEFHAQKSGSDWPRELEFRRLLEIYVQVCNVVAYAHHKGVLHRDIKPDNVMLGSYGETVVVDWGLAKLVGQPEEAQASAVRLSGSGSTATQQGAIVGSPLYMSPEGAEGRPEAVDHSSDVYLLGATLYEILCNRPPRQGSSSWELIDMALHGRPTEPRKLDPRIPRPLEAICLKAMAYNKRDRYESPLALAEDVERYLGAAPTLAYREPPLLRAARWMRRHRHKILQGIGAVLVLALAAWSIHSFRESRMLSQREHDQQELAEFYRLADEAQFYAANTDAISERVPYYDPRRAQASGEAAIAIARPWGDNARNLSLVEKRADFVKSDYALLLLMAQNKLRTNPSETASREALALLEQAAKLQTPSRSYFELRSQCQSRLNDRLAAEGDRYRANAPDVAVLAQDHFLAGETLRLRDFGASARKLADDTDAHREHLVAAINEYRQALALEPQHYWARYQIGRCLVALGRGPEAIEALSACIALRPQTPWAYSMRGLASALADRSDDAIDDLDHALRLEPSFQPARLNRGVVHWLLQQDEAAAADFTACLAAPVDKRLIEAAFYRGQLLLERNRDREAVDDFSAVIADRPELKSAYWLRAKAQFRLGAVDAALTDLNQFLVLDGQIAKTTTAAEKHLYLGKSLRSIAQQLSGEARANILQLAEKELQSAIAAGPPQAEMWQHLGAVRELLGSNAEAAEDYSKALALAADNVAILNLRAWNYANQKKYDPAQADFSEAIRLAPQNAEAHLGVGFVLAELGHENDARQEASTALLLAGENQLVLHNVACIYGRLSASTNAHRIEYENLALSALSRAVLLSKQHPIEPDLDEITLIHGESAFPASLKSRPEFQNLVQQTTSNIRRGE